MTWHSISFKPLSVAFGLKDKNGDGVLTINGAEHVTKTEGVVTYQRKFETDSFEFSLGGDSDIESGPGDRRLSPATHI